jgi:hypothetical protein
MLPIAVSRNLSRRSRQHELGFLQALREAANHIDVFGRGVPFCFYVCILLEAEKIYEQFRRYPSDT